MMLPAIERSHTDAPCGADDDAPFPILFLMWVASIKSEWVSSH